MAIVSRLGAPSLGVFRGNDAVERGVTRNQLARLRAGGVIERVHPDTYRLTAVPPSSEQQLRAALLWAGSRAAACGRSAGEMYGLEGVRAERPEIAVPREVRGTSTIVLVHHYRDRRSLMVRHVRDLPTTGVECTLLRLAASLDNEAFEVACEDARRRRLTSVPAMRAYLGRFGQPGRAGVVAARRLLDELDPVHAARSTLEVKTRRLLVANGITDFAREFPLEWNGRTYRYDFAFEKERTILETNGRRWHDDPTDYEHDNEKWSVPGRHGYRIVFATWDKVTVRPSELLNELAATIAGCASRQR
jgi:very-short-patch-repair endonuclease